jgi:hypothetical protein
MEGSHALYYRASFVPVYGSHQQSSREYSDTDTFLFIRHTLARITSANQPCGRDSNGGAYLCNGLATGHSQIWVSASP